MRLRQGGWAESSCWFFCLRILPWILNAAALRVLPSKKKLIILFLIGLGLIQVWNYRWIIYTWHGVAIDAVYIITNFFIDIIRLALPYFLTPGLMWVLRKIKGISCSCLIKSLNYWAGVNILLLGGLYFKKFVWLMWDLIMMIIIFIKMSSLMFGQLCLLFEGLITLHTLEGFLSGMSSQVVFQVA